LFICLFIVNIILTLDIKHLPSESSQVSVAAEGIGLMRAAASVRVLGVLIALGCGPAFAHHATTMFDYTKTVTLHGSVRELQWTNPHSYLQLVVPKEGGGTDEWSIEIGTPNINVRMGWRSDSLKPGDKVTITFSPTKDGMHAGTLRTVTLPDGHVLYGVANGVKTDAAGNPTINGQGLPSLSPTAPK
jgi:Family of unknown function (DUF6152)